MARQAMETVTTPYRAVIPADVRELFENPALLIDESKDEYLQLVSQLAAVVNPGDFLEWIELRDIADLIWNAQRFRKIKAAALKGAQAETLASLLFTMLRKRIVDGETRDEREDARFASDLKIRKIADRLAWGYLADRAADKQEVNKVLEGRIIDNEVLRGIGVADRIEAFERLDRIIANSDTRRIAALRELERRRATVRVPDVPRLRAPTE